MEKYKAGDIIRVKKGDKSVIIDIQNDEALIFNITRRHPEKIKLSEIKEKINDPNCNVVIEKICGNISDKDVQKVCDDFEEELDETKQTLIETLKTQNTFLRDLVNTILSAAIKSEKN